MPAEPYGYPPQGGYSPPREDPYAGQGRGRRSDDNVSAEPSLNNTVTTAAIPATGVAAATPEEGGFGFDSVRDAQSADGAIIQV